MPRVREKVAWALAGALGLAVVAAVSGVIEGGPLDPPGPPAATDSVRLPGTPISSLPFTASQPGHYYVTRNLTSGSEGILITASDVSIDLNGFTISGPGATGTGINIDQTRTRTTIRNGAVRSWNFGIRQLLDDNIDTEIVVEDVTVASTASNAIALAGHARVRNCTVTASGGIGLLVSSGASIIEGCDVRGASFIGISAGGSSIVRNCEVTGVTAAPNSGAALSAGGENVVESCRIHDNSTGNALSAGANALISNVVVEGNTIEFNAVSVAQGSAVRDCVVRGNTGAEGIHAAEATVIENCTVETNAGAGIVAGVRAVVRASAVASNGGDGIVAGEGSLVEGNTVADNGGDGIEANNGVHIVGNVSRLNGVAIADGAGIHSTGTGNYIEDNDLSSNDIGIRSDAAPNVIVHNTARNHAVANYQTQATDLTGVLITAANEGTNSVPHYNDAP